MKRLAPVNTRGNEKNQHFSPIEPNSSKKHHVVFSVKKIQELRRRDVRTTYIYSIMCKRPPEQFSEGGTGII